MYHTEKSVFERISSEYYDLTEAERKVADYVVIHRRDTQLMSISELGEACGVAEATVSRFCRRLNYKGYSAFKLAVANSDVRPPEGEVRLEAVQADDPIPVVAQKLYAADTEALAQTMALVRPEEVQRAVEMLTAARQVLCMGQGGSMILASECAHLFSTAFSNYRAVEDSHLQSIAAAHLTSRDVVLFFSYSGSTRELMDLLPLVKDRGAGVILVSHFPKSPAAAFADVILQCGAVELPLQHGSIPARMGQLFLADLLFAEVCRKLPEESEAGRAKVAGALSGKHI